MLYIFVTNSTKVLEFFHIGSFGYWYSFTMCIKLSNRVLTRQGKVRGKWNFTKVRELSGNFDECQGNLKNEAKVREMSGNFETLSGKFALGCLKCL